MTLATDTVLLLLLCCYNQSERKKAKLPTHIELSADGCGLAKDSVVLLEQIRTIDKKRLKERMGRT